MKGNQAEAAKEFDRGAGWGAEGGAESVYLRPQFPETNTKEALGSDTSKKGGKAFADWRLGGRSLPKAAIFEACEDLCRATSVAKMNTGGCLGYLYPYMHRTALFLTVMKYRKFQIYHLVWLSTQLLSLGRKICFW